jgi:hypothetical protein
MIGNSILIGSRRTPATINTFVAHMCSVEEIVWIQQGTSLSLRIACLKRHICPADVLTYRINVSVK